MGFLGQLNDQVLQAKSMDFDVGDDDRLFGPIDHLLGFA